MTFSEDEVREIVRLLDQLCWNCSGGDDVKACGVCNGSGYTLTAAGAALLEFTRRHTQEQP